MAKSKIGTIAFNCGACGASEMSFDEDIIDTSEVHCAKCGAFVGTIGGLRSTAYTAAKSAMPEISDLIRKQLNL